MRHRGISRAGENGKWMLFKWRSVGRDGEMKGKWSNGGMYGAVESMCANEEGVALG